MGGRMYEHQDSYRFLDEDLSVRERVERLHQQLRRRQPAIDRLAVALHDPASDLLKTYIYSSVEDSPLGQYEARLSHCRSLLETLNQGRPRVVQDMALFAAGRQPHTQALERAGYRSSYTLAMQRGERLEGFIFFNSQHPDVFQGALLDELDLLGHLIAEIIYHERDQIGLLSATVHSSVEMTRYRDPETGAHLARMANYARLIARRTASRFGLDDELIEKIFLFAPLHDLGKLAVPDHVLLKPDRLTSEEWTLMRSHARRGREMVDALLNAFGLEGVAHVGMLRNIVEHHHEALDGSGYPGGLQGETIPVEARIVTVADVFDALTSERRYKVAWSNDAAFDLMRELAGVKLDPDCVEALIAGRAEVEAIQARYAESDPAPTP